MNKSSKDYPHSTHNSIYTSDLASRHSDGIYAPKMNFNQMVESYAERGQYLLGFSDLSGLSPKRYPDLVYGITIGLHLDDNVIDGIMPGPTEEYRQHYSDINHRLRQIADHIQREIQSTVYAATVIKPTVTDALVNRQHKTGRVLRASFSHKMAATRAGLGWIGKTALFISRKFGPRVRLATVLTNYPLDVGEPVEVSECGACDLCVRTCPGKAANGTNWNIQREREDFFDARKCLETCWAVTKARLGDEQSICGMCMAVCPVGRKHRDDGLED